MNCPIRKLIDAAVTSLLLTKRDPSWEVWARRWLFRIDTTSPSAEKASLLGPVEREETIVAMAAAEWSEAQTLKEGELRWKKLGQARSFSLYVLKLED